MKAKSGHLSQKALASASQDRICSMLAALDFLADWDSNGATGDRAASLSLTDQVVKVNVYERTSTGVMAPWSSLELSVDASKDPAPVTIKVRTPVLIQLVSQMWRSDGLGSTKAMLGHWTETTPALFCTPLCCNSKVAGVRYFWFSCQGFRSFAQVSCTGYWKRQMQLGKPARDPTCAACLSGEASFSSQP